MISQKSMTGVSIDRWSLGRIMALLAVGVLLGLSVSLGRAAEVIATIPVSGDQTSGVGVNPITNRVYVAGILSDTVSVIDGVTNTVMATAPVAGGQGVDVNPRTNRVYVVHVFDQTVSVIDGATNRVVATVEGLAYRPRGVGVNPTTNRVYVGNHGNGSEQTVAVIDGASDTIIATVTVGAGPHGIGVNPTTNRLYVGNDVDNTVSVIDGETNGVLATIPVGGRPLDLGVNPVTNRIYVSNYNDNTVSVLDGETNTVIATISGVIGPRGIGVNSETNRLYVCNSDAASVSVIDGATHEVMETVAVGNGPGSCAVNPSTGRIYVASGLDNTVSVLDDNVPLTPLAAQATLSVGSQAAADTFALQATFLLGDSSDGIDPLTEAVTLQAGTSALTIPAGSFYRTPTGTFQFAGDIAGASLQVTLTPLTRATFEIVAHGEGGSLRGIVVPVPVGLTIGNDSGSATLPVAKVRAHSLPPQRERIPKQERGDASRSVGRRP